MAGRSNAEINDRLAASRPATRSKRGGRCSKVKALGIEEKTRIARLDNASSANKESTLEREEGRKWMRKLRKKGREQESTSNGAAHIGDKSRWPWPSPLWAGLGGIGGITRNGGKARKMFWYYPPRDTCTLQDTVSVDFNVFIYRSSLLTTPKCN